MWKKKAQEAQQEGQDAASQKKEEGRDLYEWVQALVCSVLAVVDSLSSMFSPIVRILSGGQCGICCISRLNLKMVAQG